MCYWLITESGQILSKSTVQHVVKDDFLNPSVKPMIEEFNERLGVSRVEPCRFYGIDSLIEGKARLRAEVLTLDIVMFKIKGS